MDKCYCNDMDKKQKVLRKNVRLLSVPGGIRTPDLLVRSQSLYPAELQAHLFDDLNIISCPD